MIYLRSNKDVVEFVKEKLPLLKSDLRLTMIIKPDLSEGFYATIVTGGLSGGTVLLQSSYEPPTNI